MNKEEVIKYFNLNNDEVDRIEYFYRTLSNKNNHMNLVGKSTIPDFWDRHICDSLQLTKYIENKNLNILDLGTGAGLPGIILSIVGYENILMVDSTSKKINFVEGIIKALSLSSKTKRQRIEYLQKLKPNIIVSRALAPLPRLLNYCYAHTNYKTKLLFLKGKSIMSEILDAKESFVFSYKKYNSISKGNGCVIQITNLKLKND